ncbi:hypothetical protein IE81DRAFT_96115 [Ceraceosorus guamensis]|uniref:Uncharacterized protein n=1 Tax=Ceraceosorus guamensis TaxID=1522189 RepID=A0A316W6R6_9BASI|nr:hypothetical protein IE81DRAFT_96115 [Ceraceosorus guamensis]PWN43335.1 hypothetical protein IE81DRAFT_96115 [Ceraceosorus guamensis]
MDTLVMTFDSDDSHSDRCLIADTLNKPQLYSWMIRVEVSDRPRLLLTHDAR